MFRKILSVILTVIIISTLFAGCAASSNSEPAPVPPASATSEQAVQYDASNSIETAAAQSADLSEVYADYLAVYRDYQWDIAQYTWHVGDGQAAICDIIGNATPELLYLTEYTDYTAYLSIYTYIDGVCTRVYYEPADVLAGSGTSYCLFTTTDSKLVMYARSAGFPMYTTYSELELNAENQLVATSTISRKSTPSEDHSTYTYVYQHDGVTISESEFAVLESELVGSMQNIAVWSCGKIDAPIMDKISEIGTSSAMSAEDAIEFLIEKAGVGGVQTAPPVDIEQEHEETGNISAFDSLNITHLDDFKKYGFTFETGEYGTSIRAYQYALISDSVKIYFGDGAFSYEIDLLDGNLRDVHQTDVHIPDMEGVNKILDVGYGIKLTSDQMKYMGFVAKCFYENPSAPFAHLVPKEIADAAAQNDIFINVTYGITTSNLSFISLRYSYVHVTYHDGSQSILPNAIEISYYADNKSQPTSFRSNGVDFNNPADYTVKQSIESLDEPGSTFDSDTLKWTFNDTVISGLVELMRALNTPYVK